MSALLTAYSPSGLETEALKVWDKFCEDLNLNPYYSDKIGNHQADIEEYCHHQKHW